VKLYTIVEGEGEVTAVPVLLRRLLHEHAQCYGVQPAPPIRRKAYEFRREDTLRAAVALAISQPDCAGVFLAALESLRGQCRIAHDAEAPPDPESRRDAKGALEEHMPRGASYAPTVHQGRLSATFDMALAYRRNRSFRKFTKAVGELLVQMRQPLTDWPPAAWRA